MKAEFNETIAAIATPPGRGGIGVVRVSGLKSLEIAKRILKKTPKARFAYFGEFYDQNDQIIDMGIALYFPSPNSFTGEDVLELHGHGGAVVLDSILQRVIALGARLARPGEFSERAFLNDKIDLAQAEAVADLIDASSQKAARSAIASLQGEFSKYIQELIDKLIHLRTYIEAEIDFSEEEIDFLTDKKIQTEFSQIKQKINFVIESAEQGAILQEGMTIVIAGKPNAGKSSLLNCLSGRDSAIVTEIAGTTRDVLREHIHIDGIPLHVIDTAGLQETGNIVEQEGIRRAWKEIEKADFVLFVVDGSLTKETNARKLWPEFFSKLPNRKVIIIQNKIDLANEKARVEKKNEQTTIYLSAKTGDGIQLLKRQLKDLAGYLENVETVFIARRRHLDALSRAKNYLNVAEKNLKEDQVGELVAEDLRQTQNALSEITGEFTTDDLLNEIFSNFCVGK